MTSTAIGQDTLTSLVRHYVLPQITDNAYSHSNALLYRLIRGNKRMQQGGTHIELPLLYPASAAGGSFSGYDVLSTAPIDNVRNGVLDWKQYYTSFSIDQSTLLRADSNLAIANLIQHNGQIATMNLSDMLGAGVLADGVLDPKGMDGLGAVLSTSNVYAGIDRSTESWWRPQIDSSTTTLTLAAMRSLFGSATIGGTHPTIWFANNTNYNRLYALNLSTTGYGVSYNREPGGHDEVLAQAGFTNILFENVPVVRETRLANTQLFALNENFIDLYVSPKGDFHVEPFQKPHNQLVYVSTVHWAGNLGVTSSRSQAAFTALTA